MQTIKSVLFVSVVILTQNNFDATKVPGLESCYPGSDYPGIFERSELISQASDGEKEYFLIYLYEPDFPYPDRLIISRPAQGGDCTQEWLDVTGDDLALSRGLNNPQIGRLLKLGMYQKKLETFGREGLQDYINEAAQESSSWYKEDIWALKQLGLSIPENVIEIEE